MKQQIRETPEARKEREARIASLKEQLSEKTRKVPRSVIDGFYQTAVDWKDAAKKGQQLIDKKTASVGELEHALQRLNIFGA